MPESRAPDLNRLRRAHRRLAQIVVEDEGAAEIFDRVDRELELIERTAGGASVERAKAVVRRLAEKETT